MGFGDLSAADLEAIVSSFAPRVTRPRHPQAQAQQSNPSQSQTSQSQSRSQALVQAQPPDAETFRQQLLASASELSLLRERNPPLADAVSSATDFARVFAEQLEALRVKERERAEMETRAIADPFDPDIQRRMFDQIQQSNIDQSMEHAMEYMPEAFGQVIMLYAS